MATLREINAFITDIESRPPEGRSITQEDFADVLQSLAKVSGAMALSTPTPLTALAAGWNRVDAFDVSRDTQGVQDGINDLTDPGGWFQIKNQGGGDYTCSGMLRFASDTAGTFEMRVSQVDELGNETTTPFQDAVVVAVGETAQLNIASALVRGVVTGQRLQLSVKGPNGAIATVIYGQFGVQR